MHKASAGYATAEGDQLRGRIDELVQELEDKNAELEEKDQIVSELKEQMVQITHLLGRICTRGCAALCFGAARARAPCLHCEQHAFCENCDRAESLYRYRPILPCHVPGRLAAKRSATRRQVTLSIPAQ